MLINTIPTTPTEVYAGGYRSALYAFLRDYVRPAVDPACIVWGNQARAVPPDTDEVIIMTTIIETRRGTNVTTFTADGKPAGALGDQTEHELITVDVQIDFYSAGDEARQRARCFESLARSAGAVEWFKAHGVGLLYADDVRLMAEPIDAGEVVQRAMTTLHLSYWGRVTQGVPWFDAVNVDIVDVDVKFPPEK